MIQSGVDVADTLSVAVVVGVLANILPTVAVVLSIIWTTIRIYEWFQHRVVHNKKEPFK